MDSFIDNESQCQERQVGCQTDHSDGPTDSRWKEHLEAVVVSQQVQLDACMKRLTALDQEFSQIRVRLVRAQAFLTNTLG